MSVDPWIHRITHNSWRNMKQRCTNPRAPNYHTYGGRGIRFDPKWSTFEGFVEDMGYRPHVTRTLEREDNDGPYCKSNCKWASLGEQANNTQKSTDYESLDSLLER